MARELRPRKSRPSYAAFVDSDNEAAHEDEGSASDDFQLEAGQEENEDMEVDASDGDSTKETDIVPSKNYSRMSRNEGLQLAQVKQALPSPVAKRARASAGLSKTAGRTYNATSAQSVDTRQRTEPIFYRPARVERLSQPPSPFRPSVVASTNSWNSSKPCADRFTKASGYNIGGGPIWQLLEDRSWWKESQRAASGETETEASRRPRVYESLEMDLDIRLINEDEARLYLPKRSNASEDTPTMKCSFGTPGKNVMKELNTFDSFSMGEYHTNVFYTGGPVWGLDWCPVYAEDQPHRRFKQYVAVAPLPSGTHSTTIGHKCSTPFPACIQIWGYAPKQSSSVKGKERALESEADFGKMLCELVLCVDGGPAHEIKWCPLPAHDSWAEPWSGGIRKLGLLAGAFEDGSLSIFVVPDPDDLRSADLDKPVFVKLQPIIQIELEETSIWSLDWANSERIAVGCTNGSVAIYDVHDAFMNESTRDLLPTHYLPIHQSAVRAVQWIPLPSTSADGLLNFTRSPTMIASGGYDGCQIVTDLRDGYGCIVNRTRDVVLSMAYSHFSEGVIGIDNDYSAKSYSMAPSTLGRGNIVVEAGGPIWSLHTSDYHPFLALGSADGSVVITNMLRSTRRSASTPFLFYKIIQMDYSRKTGEYRMLDHFLPQELPDRSTATASKKAKKLAAETMPPRTGAQGVGAWSPEVSVTRVAWNNGAGLARAPLLASVTASGLCRIDWLLGHFQGNRVPYGGVEFIRFEMNNGRQIDDEEDD